MSEHEAMHSRLHEEYEELDRCIAGLQQSAEMADGCVRQYREQRLRQALEVRESFAARIRMLGSQPQWTEAERLWNDLRRAVRGLSAPVPL